MNFERCAITGYKLKPEQIKPLTSMTLEYETEFVGKVKITLPTYEELLKGDFEHSIIGGICMDRTLRNEEPVLIDGNFIREGYKGLNPPTQFEEKCYHFLKYLYQFGGRENKEFEFYSTRHFAFAFADIEEFERIIDHLKGEYFISIKKHHPSHNLYMGVKLTKTGKEEAKKTLPKIPLFNLVSQEITTGDTEVDESINHARKLFFDEIPSLDKMRSACETLSYVLEPLREDLKKYFNQKDVSDFFQIVNTFDIRHNKDTTKILIHEEQLEWVFYSLLNTINAYTKLRQRGIS